MNSNVLVTALIEEIESQLNEQGITDFEVSRNFQPSQQFSGGDNYSDIKTQIYLHAISNPSLGHSRKYNSDNTKRADLQHLTKVYQVSVLHAFDYTDVDAMPPEDMCALVRALIDSPDAIKSLRAKNIFLQEVTDLRPIFFVNDKDQNESVPNFDLTAVYRSEIIKNIDYVDNVVGVVGSVPNADEFLHDDVLLIYNAVKDYTKAGEYYAVVFQIQNFDESVGAYEGAGENYAVVFQIADVVTPVEEYEEEGENYAVVFSV